MEAYRFALKYPIESDCVVISEDSVVQTSDYKLRGYSISYVCDIVEDMAIHFPAMIYNTDKTLIYKVAQQAQPETKGNAAIPSSAVPWNSH